MTENGIRVRIAPSPSGYLHVGTARTAIFNWLYARRNGGRFLVRIEDTDAARSDESLIQPILDALSWLGIDWDEKPIHQSARLERYKSYVDRLLDNNHAYRCFCTPEELDERRKQAMAEKRSPHYDRRCLRKSPDEIRALLDRNTPFAVRLKIPPGSTSFNDEVLGNITRENGEIEDLVICRTDGRVTYNMAVVVDDHEMGITDVIRGNDHISNTFKQILIYNGLGLELPRFAHIPLVLRPDKKKVSKRLGDKDGAEYGREGILPEAMFNFLCLLGWSPKDDREYLPREELKKIFELKNVNPSNPIFDEDKLIALNFKYIMNTPDYKLAEMAAPFIVAAGHTTKYWLETRWDYLVKVVGLLKERCRRLTDFADIGFYFFHSDFNYDEKAVEKRFGTEAAGYLEALAARFEKIGRFDKENIEEALGQLADELQVKKAALIHPARLAVSGLPGGPGLYDILETIGKDEVIKRLKKAAAFIKGMGK